MGSLEASLVTVKWQTEALDVVLVENKDGVICLHSLLPHGVQDSPSSSTLLAKSDVPLISLRIAGEGTASYKTSKCLIGSYMSTRLKYQKHDIKTDPEKDSLDIHTYDEQTGIHVVAHLVIYKGIPVLRSSATITNHSQSSPIVVTQLSSLTIGGLTATSEDWVADYTLMTATNSWCREAQWREHSLPDIGIDENGTPDGHPCSLANFSLSSRGSFSTGSYLPMGLLKCKDGKDTWIWQIENNGSWRWEIGDYFHSIYLSLGGPTAIDHDFKQTLQPGESFTTISVACSRVAGGVDAAFGVLTDYRRKIRRHHEDNENLPIIFNDYMNCLMGDPDEEKIEALLEPVCKMGAEYFVIDAGWYADDSTWWDDVGLWEPSKKRFPSGFSKLLDTIRSKNLKPGLWIEPEVVGVRSIVAKKLPEEAFFHESGQRIVEKGRYQLDYRHPEVRSWMNSVIRRLVVDYGAQYFKFDYNIEVIQGPESVGESTGLAHLEHHRAYLSWVQELLDRYPGLVIENCSSGAQRMEYAMLSIHPLQSTSDQEDPVLYSTIAAAVPTAVAPEQSATWAYPQPEWDDEINALTVVNSLLGRIHLSGRLDRLKPHQSDLIREGMKVYSGIRHALKSAHPIWPIGLPKWHDDWVCLGMLSSDMNVYVSVWRRGGPTGPTEMDIPLPSLTGCLSARSRLLYPSTFEAESAWKASEGLLHVKLPNRICARLFQVEA